jgi:predicted nuclease of predicted toxin-antitoxin system
MIESSEVARGQCPPYWLRLGNCSTLQVENLLRRDFNAIKLFYEDDSLSLLALS